jgi:very-short-patch-repair endonuclease
VIHEGAIFKQDRTVVERIPVTSVARTLFDLAEVVDERQLARAFEEADRLRVLELSALDAVCARGYGRRALRPIRQLMDLARLPDHPQSPLEDLVLELCREQDLPTPVTGATVMGREVDALWPAARLMVEADSWQFHGHRAAFERDRERDAAMQAEGYRVIRLTHRRLEREPAVVADQLRRLLKHGGGRASS